MKLFSVLALLANQQAALGQNPASVGQTTDGQMRFRLQELRLVNSLANAIKKCQCNENGIKPIDLNRYREKSQECDCCWSVGCLCPMPNQVQKIASSFTREVDQNIGFLNANLGSTNDKVEDDWKKKIKDLRWRKKKILDTARKNMVEGKCLKCNHRAPKCDKARRRASIMAPAFYENYETPKTLAPYYQEKPSTSTKNTLTQAIKQNEEKIKLFAQKLPTPKITTLAASETTANEFSETTTDESTTAPITTPLFSTRRARMSTLNVIQPTRLTPEGMMNDFMITTSSGEIIRKQNRNRNSEGKRKNLAKKKAFLEQSKILSQRLIESQLNNEAFSIEEVIKSTKNSTKSQNSKTGPNYQRRKLVSNRDQPDDAYTTAPPTTTTSTTTTSTTTTSTTTTSTTTTTTTTSTTSTTTTKPTTTTSTMYIPPTTTTTTTYYTTTITITTTTTTTITTTTTRKVTTTKKVASTKVTTTVKSKKTYKPSKMKTNDEINAENLRKQKELEEKNKKRNQEQPRPLYNFMTPKSEMEEKAPNRVLLNDVQSGSKRLPSGSEPEFESVRKVKAQPTPKPYSLIPTTYKKAVYTGSSPAALVSKPPKKTQKALETEKLVEEIKAELSNEQKSKTDYLRSTTVLIFFCFLACTLAF